MSIYAVDRGDGPAVMCLHGIGSSSGAFRHQVDALAGAGFRAIAWDAPGYGRSPEPDAPPGMAGYADAVAALLDDKAIDDVRLLGMSWGGVIAVAFALRRPDRLKALILGDTTMGSGTDSGRAADMRTRPAQLAHFGPADFARRRAARLLSAHAATDLLAEVESSMAADVRLPGYQWAAEAMAATDHRDRLADVQAPTLVLWGEEDTVVSEAENRAIAAGIPHATFATIPAAGHLSNQEQPAHFNQLILGFLGKSKQDAALPLATNQGATS